MISYITLVVNKLEGVALVTLHAVNAGQKDKVNAILAIGREV